MRRIHLAALAAFFTAGIFSTAQAQTFDGSGNSMLNGDYGFRHVTFYNNPTYGTITRAIVLDGVITFDGAGNYTMTGYARDTSQGAGNFTFNGTYRISASGFGYIQNPNANVAIFGGVTNGSFVGSTTEAVTANGPAFNDIFIATQSYGATAADVQGNYSISYFSVPTPITGRYPYDALATFAADGKGGIGTATVTAYGAGSTTPSKLKETGITYSFSSGVGQMIFPALGGNQNPAIGGTHTFFVSPDGNLIFGGSNNYLDFWVGVKTPSGSTAGLPTDMNGLYYQVGMSYDTSQLSSSGVEYLDTFYGSFYANNGVLLSHAHAAQAFVSSAVDFTNAYDYPTDSGATYINTTNNRQYVLSADGSIRVGFGLGPYLGASLALRAPQFSSPGGVYINPVGIQNAASYALFTAGVSPGEIITINGSGFADGIAVANTFPLSTTLSNVQVQVNSTFAPLISVTPTTVSFVMPYDINGQQVASIQVQTNNGNSNALTMLVRGTSIGAFSAGANGIGPGAILHPADYSLVTSDNPAQPGETVAVYFTGGGTVSPPVINGQAAPSSPPAAMDSSVKAYVNGESTTSSFSGLAPGYAGLYQANIVIPTDATTGALDLLLCAGSSCSDQVTVAVGPAN